MDTVREIARAVLYEGYLLWPYRRSTLKNRKRWTFGGVYPRSYAESCGEGDAWRMQLQCLVEGDGDVRVDVELRFLHAVERQPARLVPCRRGLGEPKAAPLAASLGAQDTAQDVERLVPVDALVIGEQRHLAWQEATERQFGAQGLILAALGSPQRVEVAVASASETEWLSGPDGRRVGALVRSWEPLVGTLDISAERLAPRLHRLTVAVTNLTPSEAGDRDEALPRTFMSTHMVVRVRDGELVSAIDPPAALRNAAEGCRNLGTWPVLVGAESERHTLLGAPIILYDHPEVAPESPGDFFDGTETDELLVHSILALSDEERREMRDSDPRGREILERTTAMSPEAILRLHGAVRELRPVEE